MFAKTQNAQRLLFQLLEDTFEMLSEYNVLRIIAELTAEQIHAADVRGVVLDADPYRDRVAGLQR